MRYILPCVEQLDLAARLLEEESPIQGRLALILADNMMEYIAHRKCEDLFRWDDVFSRTLGSDYTDKDRADALGQHFDRKIKFLARAGDLDEDTRDFALMAHAFRNEAYHVGVIHDDFIYDLAHSYHSVVCATFKSLKPGVTSYPAPFSASEAVRRYFGGDDPASSYTSVDLETLAISLDDAKPARKRTLAEALSASVRRRIEHTEEAVDFVLSDDAGWPRSFEDAVVDLQYWELLLVHEIGKNTPGCRSAAHLVLDHERERVENTYSIAVRAGDFARWRRRAGELRAEPDDTRALRKFLRLVSEFEDFERLADDAAVALDQAIQMKVDRLRGK